MILAIVFYLSTQQPIASYQSVDLTHPDIVVLLFAFLAVGKLVKRALSRSSRSDYLPRQITIALVLMLTSALLSTLVAQDTVRAAAGSVQVIEFGLLALCVSYLVSHDDVFRILHFLLLVLLLEALLAFQQVAAGDPEPAGTFFKNQKYAIFEGAGAAVALGLLAGIRTKTKAFVYMGTMCILAFGSLVGQKRAAWLSLLIAGLSVVSLQRDHRRKALILVLSGVLLVSLAVLTVPSVREAVGARLDEARSYQTRGNTLYSRFLLWTTAWDLFLEHPLLGIGPKNYLSVVPGLLEDRDLLGSPTLDAHNVWLGMLAEQGILGFCAYIYMCYAILMLGRRGFINAQSDSERALYLGYIAYHAFWFCMSYNYFTKAEGHLHFMMIGMAAGFQRVSAAVPPIATYKHLQSPAART